ncbi:MAG TPA: MFS transporter [Azoarcus taiwanensis]|nr:MFS transporter [Azoarcus taiwanensis]
MMNGNRHIPTLLVALAAAALMGVTMGSRSSFGLFVSPLNTTTGLGLVTISFAAALNHLLWGIAQPAAGLAAERFGVTRVIVVGCVSLAMVTALLPFARSATELVLVLSLLAVTGAAAGSNGILLSEVSRRVDAEHRGLAIGIVGAGGSVGQLVLGPITQGMISWAGWQAAMFALAVLALLAAPLAWAFRRGSAVVAMPSPSTAGMPVRDALASPALWLIALGFGVCGFHVSFLISHMPGVIAACGLPPSVSGWWIAVVGLCNVVGSLAAGSMIRRGSMRTALIVLYALRAIGVGLFLALPKTEWVVLGFAGWMGLTYMATLPPTAGLVGKLFGLRHMATLLGVVMLVHQLGAFLGVWLGGVAVTVSGHYDWIWYADILLALVAVVLHLPIREAASPDDTARNGATGATPAWASIRPATA